MFGTKKQIEELRTQLAELQETVNTHSKALDESQERTKTLQATIAEATEKLTTQISQNTEYENSIAQHADRATALHDEFSRALDQIKRQHTNFEQRVIQQLHSSIKEATSTLRADADKYRALKEEIAQTRDLLGGVQDDLRKFQTVGKKIKASDFEATQFAKKVFGADQEKLRLMKELDKLKSIVSRQRKRH